MANNTSNGPVVYQTKRGLTNMEAFDKLPKAAREALANADHNWSAASLYDAHKARRIATFKDARFEVGKSANAVAFISYQDKRKHREDAAQGIVCPDQR